MTVTLSHAQIMGNPNTKIHQRSKNEYRSECPCCGSSKQLLYWPDVGNYWCRSCELHGFVDQAAGLDPVRLAELESERERRERQRREEETRAREKIRAMASRADYYHDRLDDEARAWWHSQGIEDETIDRYNLGYRPVFGLQQGHGWRRETDSYTIPNYRDGELVGIRHRLAKDIDGKYRPEIAGLGQQLFNVDRLGRTDGLMDAGEAVLVEGEKKAIVLDQAGFTVVSVPGKTLSDALASDLAAVLEANGIHRLYIALDPDAVDQARALAVTIPGSIVASHRLPGKPDDILVDGTVTPAELYTLLSPHRAEIRARRDAILAEAEAERQAKEAAAADRAAELHRRYQAGVAIAFAGDVPDPDQLEQLRRSFSSASRWRDYCRAHWPDIDADEQYRIKLEENREARPDRCGEYRKFVLPNGQTVTRRWTCGVCEECQKRGVWIYRRAIGEITGQPIDSTAEPLSLEDLQAADLDQTSDEPPRENAPPLPVVHGDITLVTVYSDEDRLKLARDLRRAGVAYRCHPLESGGRLAYDFLVNDDRGEPLALLTDGRLAGWVRGYKNKRASGAMLPSLKKLQKRYRPALPYEVVLPELDDDGRPVDPDIFALDLPDIGTSAQLPPVLVDFRVYDADTLQAALIEINNQQCKILGRRGDVNYGVYTKKRMYTRYSTLDRMIAEFNAWQEAIWVKKQLE